MERYARQMRFAGIGEQGQARLAQASVAILGLGATGSAALQTLVRAGVGRIRIVDRDWVEEHNLPRQQLYTEADAREQRPKAVAAAQHAQQINSAANIAALVADINAETIAEAVGAADVLVDGSDNLELRYLINEWCVQQQRPWVYTGVVSGYGMTATLRPGGPCLRCLFPQTPEPGSLPTCETAGVVGSMVGVMANLAATEVLKLLVGSGQPNPGLLIVDGWRWAFDQLPLPPKQPDCPVCGRGEFVLLNNPDSGATQLCGRNAIQVRPAARGRIELEQLAARLAAAGCRTRLTEHLLRFAAEAYQITVFPDGRAIISGTEDPLLARSIYARWIGL